MRIGSGGSISLFFNAVMKRKDWRVFAKRVVYFPFRPNVERSFGVLSVAGLANPGPDRAVRILGRIESTLGRSHVPPDVIKNVAGGRRKLRFGRYLKSIEICAGQLRLIVKHFLEMRHVPVVVDRIPVIATTDMIVHP